eukprot:COSAG02_NODE_11405_length_1730_cov_1.383814_3_plen_99_part_00
MDVLVAGLMGDVLHEGEANINNHDYLSLISLQCTGCGGMGNDPLKNLACQNVVAVIVGVAHVTALSHRAKQSARCGHRGSATRYRFKNGIVWRPESLE